MRYLGEDEVTQMMGIGYVGEVRQGPDGNLYQWIQGVDGLGNPVGSWLKRLRRVASLVQRGASLIPHPAAQAVAAGLKAAKAAGIAGVDGLGALYQAPDGTVYQVQGLAEDEELRGLAEDEDLRGLAEDEELRGLAEDEATQMMGIGYVGEVRQGPDGNLYQWVQGADGLGNPVGSWLKRLRRVASLVQRGASLIPHPAAQAVAAGLKAAKAAGIAGVDGLGALYQAPDGTVYQVQGLAEDEALRGLAEDEELRGLAEDEELRGLAEDEDLRGLAEDEELRGLAEDEELRGLAEDEDLRGLAEDEDLQGYVREDGMSGVEAYVPVQRARTRRFTRPAQAPEMWKPMW